MNEYFSHDYKARLDRKLVSVQMKHGMGGIGIFWCIVENIYENGGYIPESDIEKLAFELRTDCERINSVLQDFDLFYKVDGFYRSESIDKRIGLRESKSNSAKKSANLRWEKVRNQSDDANALPTQCEGNAIKLKESKLKEIKEEEERVKKPKVEKIEFGPSVHLTQKEYDDFLEKYGLVAVEWMIEKLSAYKEAKGKTYKSDAGAIRSWVINEYQKINPNGTTKIRSTPYVSPSETGLETIDRMRAERGIIKRSAK